MAVKKQMAPLILSMGHVAPPFMRLSLLYRYFFFHKFFLRGKEVKLPYVNSLKITRNNIRKSVSSELQIRCLEQTGKKNHPKTPNPTNET